MMFPGTYDLVVNSKYIIEKFFVPQNLVLSCQEFVVLPLQFQCDVVAVVILRKRSVALLFMHFRQLLYEKIYSHVSFAVLTTFCFDLDLCVRLVLIIVTGTHHDHCDKIYVNHLIW